MKKIFYVVLILFVVGCTPVKKENMQKQKFHYINMPRGTNSVYIDGVRVNNDFMNNKFSSF